MSWFIVYNGSRNGGSCMEEKYCQSCGMPMSGEKYGTCQDGSLSEDYCAYCMKDGEFTFKGSMEEMIEFCLPMMIDSGMEKEEALKNMQSFYPYLKRWQKITSY